MAAQTRPEPMNASPHHSKVKVSMTLPNPIFVAGAHVSGKMEMECRADRGLGIGVMMVELFAVQELTSRDHSATSTFLHSRRLFQGPGLPPSNAVQAHPMPGDPQLPQSYHQARRGTSTFLFRIPIPSTSPSSISFGSDLARVKYEVRASVAVAWKGEKRLVTCKREIDVVESFEEDFARIEPEAVVVGEHGKIWIQGKVVGGLIVAGESACVELQVKNHSSKKNAGLTLTLSRTLVLPGLKPGEKSPLQISDVLTTVPFRGADYVIPPGAEGVASLVFDVPTHARGVKGGTLEGDESEERTSESLFEIRCIIGITLNMGIGTKDIQLDIRVPIVHPAALPEPVEITSTPAPYGHHPYPLPSTTPAPYLQTPYAYPPLPVSPPIPGAYLDPSQNQVWLPPPISHTPQPYFSPPIEAGQPQQYYFPPPPNIPIPTYIPTRPLSAGPAHTDAFASNAAGIGMGPPPISGRQHLVLLDNVEPEEGKGERASRITQHLRLSSRHRSVSPMSHRFPLPAPPIVGSQHSLPAPVPSSSKARKKPKVSNLRNLPPPPPLTIPAPNSNNLSTDGTVVHSPRPFLSPKHSYSNSLPKSERVEQLERMAEDVAKATADLSGDLPKLDLPQPSPILLAPPFSAAPVAPPLLKPSLKPQDDLEPHNVNKTLPSSPLPTIQEPANKKATDARTRIDTYFTSSVPDEPQAPPTPLAAVTPVKLPSKPKSSEFRAQLLPNPNGASESGLDALEKRLLAEVGTRKLDLSDRRPDARSVVGLGTVNGMQPINIPAKDVPPEPLYDSAISSLTLAGEGFGGLEEERPQGHGREREYEQEVDLDLDHDRDSDERTHRAGRSSISGESRGERRGERGRKPRKSDDGGKDGKRKEKERVKDGEGHSSSKKKKSAAAKGRVAAWLGEIDPEVPPVDDVVPSSPAVARKPTPILEGPGRAEAALDKHEVKDSAVVAAKPEGKEETISAVPNPRSSGFVPIGTIKHDTLQRRPNLFTKEMTVVEEARRVADIWSSSPGAPSPAAVIKSKLSPNVKDNSSPEAKDISSAVVKGVSPVFPVISPAARTAQSIRTDRRTSPPSSAAAADLLGAKLHSYNADRSPVSKPLQTKPQIPPKVIAQPSPQLPAFPHPQLDPEVKYDVRSARGGRGGRVTAVASIWASGALAEPKARDAQRKPSADLPFAPHKPLRAPFTDPANRDTPKKAITYPTTAISKPQRAPMKSLLTASASLPTTATTTAGEPRLVELAGKRMKPVIKSSSVPAVLSSSHATPTLSSTASLARPSPAKVVRPPVKISPMISEVKSDVNGKAHVTSKAPLAPTKPATSTGGDLAFGQARLRDLIKKYQGQAT
ncbi:hypothetical protein Hypma_006233 [Hypsizygus marmoreus]|uniref:Arrestin-like N-terminal domain-containing protein n=1 Tax=Hypsizygus marmoreus TaxID=39966 RepID=A0A369JTD4_HYPMA|nr:hypothetical protein Hypma_006233 [Hypsizygus marmoreus]